MKSFTARANLTEERVLELISEGQTDTSGLQQQINQLIQITEIQSSLIQTNQSNIMTLSGSHNALALRVAAAESKITTLQSQMTALQARVTDTEVTNVQQDSSMLTLQQNINGNFANANMRIENVCKVLMTNYTIQTFALMNLHQALSIFTTEYMYFVSQGRGGQSQTAQEQWSFPTGLRYQDSNYSLNSTHYFWNLGFTIINIARGYCGTYTGSNAYEICANFASSLSANTYSKDWINGKGAAQPVPDKYDIFKYKSFPMPPIWTP